MDDLTQAAERGGRLDELPQHEDDSDVADQAGGGLVGEGGTAEVRGTGERRGAAQAREAARAREPVHDDLSESPSRDETPGLMDYTDAQEPLEADATDASDATHVTPDFGDAPGDVGAGGLRPPRLDR